MGQRASKVHIYSVLQRSGFDVTYKTKFRMSFAQFIGVNQHLQSILFECALLEDENNNDIRLAVPNLLDVYLCNITGWVFQEPTSVLHLAC